MDYLLKTMNKFNGKSRTITLKFYYNDQHKWMEIKYHCNNLWSYYNSITNTTFSKISDKIIYHDINFLKDLDNYFIEIDWELKN